MYVKPKSERPRRRKITAETRMRVLEGYNGDRPITEIARENRICVSSVYNIIRKLREEDHV